MYFKKVTLGLMAGLISAALFTGCLGGGDKGSGDNDGPKPAATPSAKIELKGDPTLTFQAGKKTAKLYELKAPADFGDFNFTGQRIVYAHDGIYLRGEAKDSKGKELEGLFKMSLKGDTLAEPEFIAESADDSDQARNLTVSRGDVIFELKEGHKIGIYNGKSLKKSDSKWKDDYDEMVGFVEGSELLLVRHLDEICTANQELSDVTGVKEAVKDARKTTKLEDAVFRPVYGDANELFVSSPLDGDDFTSALFSFDRKGKLLHRYDGLPGEGEWAVTKQYVLQAGQDGDLAVYERESGQKIYDSKVRDLDPKHFAFLGGDTVLIFDTWNNKFWILSLE